ncbi:MAG: hypothetical protein AAB317_01690 [Nitrospirota bacterium]
MSKKVRVFLFLFGCWIFFSWGFRLYILAIRWTTDPFRFRTLLFALVFLTIGFFLVRLGKRGVIADQKEIAALLFSSLFIVLYFGIRLFRSFLYPDIDPNPRSHLHLSVTYIVLGLSLFAIAMTERIKRSKQRAID